MVEELLREAIQQHFSGLKRTPSGWMKHNCPMCVHHGHAADKKERFGILHSQQGIGLNCFNCGFSTSWQAGQLLNKKVCEFLKVIGVPQEDINKLKFESFREQNNVVSKNVSLRGNITKKWKEIELMPDCYPLRFWAEEGCEAPDFLRVFEYAMSRGVVDIDRMYWTPIKDFMYHRRITLPFYYRGNLVGWTGRLAGNVDGVSKYHNNMPPSFIYGLDDQQDYERRYHFITEGVLDAIVTNGVAVLHNNINDEQAALINSLPGEKVLIPDRDSSGDELVEIAIQNKWSVSFPNWGRDSKKQIIKDVAHAAMVYGHLLTLQSVVEYIERDPYRIRFRRKADKVDYGY